MKRLDMPQLRLLVEALREEGPEDRHPALLRGIQDVRQLLFDDEIRCQEVLADQENRHPRGIEGRPNLLAPFLARLDQPTPPQIKSLGPPLWSQHGEKPLQPLSVFMAVAHEDRGPVESETWRHWTGL